MSDLEVQTDPAELPSAFLLEPLPEEMVREPHDHAIGMTHPACPPDSTFQGKVTINGKIYCRYVGDSGQWTMIRCDQSPPLP